MAALSRAVAVAVGVALAMMPALAEAQGAGGRALGTADDFWKVGLLTALGVAALLAVAAIGYLYRRERGLAWEFQRPDPDDRHDEGDE